MSDERFVNEVRHVCGCVTVFDVRGWRSVARVLCDDHRVISVRLAGSGGE